MIYLHMAFKVIIMSLMVVLMSHPWTQTAAQSGCTSALVSMASCLNFITGNSSSPSSSCCSQLSNVIQSSPSCLCSVLSGGGASLGININRTLALSLPGACNVQTPPISQCNVANAPTSSATAPVGSPANTPSGSSAETPEAGIAPTADNPSGAGSKSVPSTDGISPTNGSMTKTPPLLMLFFLFMVSSAFSIIRF